MSMRKISIDLRPEKKSGAMMVLLWCLIVLVISFLLVKIISNHFKIKNLVKNARIVSAADADEFEKAFDVLSRNLSKKKVSWVMLFDRIEQSLPEEVVITSLKTEASKENFFIQGSSRTSDGIFKTIEELKKSNFRDVDLVSHSSAPKTKDFTFTLNAKYL